MTRYYTYDEITRQPSTWEKTITQLLNKADELNKFFKDVKPDEVIFTGCGTSFYISIAAALVFEEITGISAKAVPASEIFLKPEATINKNKRTLLIGSSRSGTTTEVIRAVDYVNKNNLGTSFIVTGYPDSELAETADYSIALSHIQEKSVVMTSSFTNILLALHVFAGIVAGNKRFISELKSIPAIGDKIIQDAEEQGKNIGAQGKYNHYIYLGLGAYLGLACEGMLKMKEMTQAVCEAFNPLEFRHGPISVLTNQCQVILLNNQSIELYEKDVILDIQSYGANTVVIGDLSEDFGNHIIRLPKGLSDAARGILYLPYLQYIAYFKTINLGLNPDTPRNLTQVVKL